MMSSAEQSIVSFILNGVELLLKITSFLSDKTSQVPHFPLLQCFVLVVFPVCTCAGKLNLARVKVRFRFGGWRLLFINFIASDANHMEKSHAHATVECQVTYMNYYF